MLAQPEMAVVIVPVEFIRLGTLTSYGGRSLSLFIDMVYSLKCHRDESFRNKGLKRW